MATVHVSAGSFSFPVPHLGSPEHSSLVAPPQPRVRVYIQVNLIINRHRGCRVLTVLCEPLYVLVDLIIDRHRGCRVLTVLHEPPRFPPSSLLHHRRLSASRLSSCRPPSLFVDGNLLRLVPAARISPISPLENPRQGGHICLTIDHHQRRRTLPRPPHFPPLWLHRPPPSGTRSGSCLLSILFSGNLLKSVCSSRPTPAVGRLEVRPSDYRSPPALLDPALAPAPSLSPLVAASSTVSNSFVHAHTSVPAATC